MGNRKNLLEKLKTGILGLGIIGASYFNAHAQTQEKENYQEKTKKVSNELQKSRTKTYPTLIHKLIEFENEPLNGATTCASLEENSLDTVIKRMEKYIPKKPASELSKKEAQNLFLKMDSVMRDQICRIQGECYQTAYMYYALGDFYNLPINLVMTPSYIGKYHLFVRWDPDGKHDALNPDNSVNKGDFNWDNESPLFLKRKFPLNDEDKYFIEEFYIPKETIEKGIYLKNMNEKEMWAFSHTIKAQSLSYQVRKLHLEKEEEIKIAEKIFSQVLNTLDTAIELDSLCIPAYYYKAYYLGKPVRNPNYNFEEAIKIVNKALELNPKQSELWNLKGIIYNNRDIMNKGKKNSLDNEALNYYNLAIDLVKEFQKIELSKKDRPVLGINYEKMYYLASSESGYLYSKEEIYQYQGIDLESPEVSKYLKEQAEITEKIKFYKEKISENPEKYSSWEWFNY
ncbi:MAG: hypothetical protein AABY06_01015 [Nanoarchaeota archaeon]